MSSLSYLPPRQSRPRKARLASDKPTTAPDSKAGLCYTARPSGFDMSKTDTILHDSTLREGDSVMTAEGLRVFQGGSACPHKESDFLALAAARDVPKSKRSVLIAIEKAVKSPAFGDRGGSYVGGQQDIAARP